MKAVLYARVSSKEQEEGFSIPAQLKLLTMYARENGLKIIEEFIDAETAKKAGRTKFNEMVKFLESKTDVNIVLCEKTDRLYRNFKDYCTIDDLNLEIHLVKENEIINKYSKSHQKFIHGIKVLMAKNYIDNLSEEIRKGMNEKVNQGYYPSLAPLGYYNSIKLINGEKIKIHHQEDINNGEIPDIFGNYAIWTNLNDGLKRGNMDMYPNMKIVEGSVYEGEEQRYDDCPLLTARICAQDNYKIWGVVNRGRNSSFDIFYDNTIGSINPLGNLLSLNTWWSSADSAHGGIHFCNKSRPGWFGQREFAKINISGIPA